MKNLVILGIVIPLVLFPMLLVVGCQQQVETPPVPSPSPSPAPTPSPTSITRDELERFSSEILLRAPDCGYIFKKASAKYPSSISPSEGAVCCLVTVISKSDPPPSDPWEGAFLREIIDLYPEATAASAAFNLQKNSASQIMDSDFGVGEQSYQCRPGHTTFRRNNLIVSIVLFGEGSGKEYAKLADMKILNYLAKPRSASP